MTICSHGKMNGRIAGDAVAPTPQFMSPDRSGPHRCRFARGKRVNASLRASRIGAIISWLGEIARASFRRRPSRVLAVALAAVLVATDSQAQTAIPPPLPVVRGGCCGGFRFAPRSSQPRFPRRRRRHHRAPARRPHPVGLRRHRCGHFERGAAQRADDPQLTRHPKARSARPREG